MKVLIKRADAEDTRKLVTMKRVDAQDIRNMATINRAKKYQ